MSFSFPNYAQQEVSRFFPVPKFLEMPYAGVDISEGAVRSLELRRTTHGFKVEKYFEEIIPSGAIIAGDIIDEAPVLKALRSVRQKMGIQFVRASLPDEKTYLFRTTIPTAPGSDIRESIEFILEENVPLGPADSLFEYSILPGLPFHDSASATVSVIVSVVSKEFISERLDLFHRAGLIPIAFEIRTQALAHAAIASRDMKPTLLVHIGHVKTTVAVVEGGKVQFSSVVAVGGANLTSAVAKTFSVSDEEAHHLEEQKSFTPTGKDAEFFSSLLNSVSVIKDEMHKVNAYWQAHGSSGSNGLHAAESSQPIERVVLSGKNAAVSGLREHFEEDMGMRVDVANVWTNVASFNDHTAPIPLRHSLSYTATVGLALPWEV